MNNIYKLFTYKILYFFIIYLYITVLKFSQKREKYLKTLCHKYNIKILKYIYFFSYI